MYFNFDGALSGARRGRRRGGGWTRSHRRKILPQLNITKKILRRPYLSFDLRAPRARPRFKISRRNEFFTISGNRGAAKANELLPTPRPISTTYQHSLSTTQPSLGRRTARATTERPNQQICRVADHQARPVPELPSGSPGVNFRRFLRLDMPQNRHEEAFPAHMAIK